MHQDKQDYKKQEINNGVMAAEEDRSSPLSAAKGNADGHSTSSLPAAKQPLANKGVKQLHFISNHVKKTFKDFKC